MSARGVERDRAARRVKDLAPQLGRLDHFNVGAEGKRKLQSFLLRVELNADAHTTPLLFFFLQAPSAVAHPPHHRWGDQEGGVVARQPFAKLHC